MAADRARPGAESPRNWAKIAWLAMVLVAAPATARQGGTEPAQSDAQILAEASALKQAAEAAQAEAERARQAADAAQQRLERARAIRRERVRAIHAEELSRAMRQAEAEARAAAPTATATGADDAYLLRIARADNELAADHPDRAELLLDECRPESRRWEWSLLKRRCRAADSGPAVRDLAGPVDWLRALAYSPDGRRLAAAGGEPDRRRGGPLGGRPRADRRPRAPRPGLRPRLQSGRPPAGDGRRRRGGDPPGRGRRPGDPDRPRPARPPLRAGLPDGGPALGRRPRRRPEDLGGRDGPRGRATSAAWTGG